MALIVSKDQGYTPSNGACVAVIGRVPCTYNVKLLKKYIPIKNKSNQTKF